ncbi:MAG TPA: LapA family protein [Oleiagrimonas sp.]|nr:LapA family protein [Oleiagrimonas sp.]
MRLVIVVLIVLLFVLAGIVFGALNPAMVVYDLGFAQVSIPKGAAILGTLVVGWLAGGIVAWLGAGVNFRRQRKIGQPAAKKAASPDGS